jgi:quercetin dioxygenase-like cupin family protein
MRATGPILLRDARQVRDLETEADDLLLVAVATRAGRAAKAMTPPGSTPLQQTMVALCAGQRLPEHEPTGPATIQVLRGVVRVTGCDVDELLRAGEWTALPASRAAIDALEEAVILMSISLDTETPWSAPVPGGA